ncbi:MAG: BrnA antitoxin family protein [Verrucomicrobiales bacterium]|jgi:hypothetical protein|nr:BrnA antitoxin family protein [Verrucomicrobiales bacterium]
MKTTGVTTKENFEERFDAGEDVSDAFDWEHAYRPNLQIQKINVDFPKWVVNSLDQAAKHIGVPRQSLIKMWIVERLKLEHA